MKKIVLGLILILSILRGYGQNDGLNPTTQLKKGSGTVLQFLGTDTVTGSSTLGRVVYKDFGVEFWRLAGQISNNWGSIVGKPSTANQIWYGPALQSSNLTYDGSNLNFNTSASNGAINFTTGIAKSRLIIAGRTISGSYNPLVGTNDIALIYGDISDLTGSLVISPHNGVLRGMKIDRNGVFQFNTSLNNAKYNFRGDTLGSVSGNETIINQWSYNTGNNSYLTLKGMRMANGTDWSTSNLRLQSSVDATNMSYIDFNNSGNFSLSMGITTTKYLELLNGNFNVSVPTFATNVTATGNVLSSGIVRGVTVDNTGGAGVGFARMTQGGTGYSGYFEGYRPNGTRGFYIGFAAGTDGAINYAGEGMNGTAHVFTGGSLNVGGNSIRNGGAGTVATDFVIKSQLDAVSSSITSSIAGTVGYIPKFVTSNTIGNSLFSDGGYMSIGSLPTYAGQIGFNRNVNGGAIFNGAFGAYQLQNLSGRLELQVYSSANINTNTHYFNNNGTVSFNTSSSSAALNVNSAGFNSIVQQLQGGANNFTLRTKFFDPTNQNSLTYRTYLDYLDGSSTNNGYISYYRAGSGSGGYLRLGTNGLDRLWLTEGGNIGANTDLEPQAKFEVNLITTSVSSLMNAGNINDVTLIRAPYNAVPATTSNGGAKWGIRFVGRNDAAFDNYKSAAIYAVSEETATGYNRAVGFAFHVSALDGVHGEKMRLNANGFLGLGVTNVVQLADFKNANGNAILSLDGLSTSTNGIMLKRAGTEAGRIVFSNSANMSFQVGSTPTEVMTLNSNISVSIATATSSQRLNIGGNILATGGVYLNNTSIGIENDGTNLYLKSGPFTYLTTANNVYATNSGNLFASNTIQGGKIYAAGGLLTAIVDTTDGFTISGTTPLRVPNYGIRWGSTSGSTPEMYISGFAGIHLYTSGGVERLYLSGSGVDVKSQKVINMQNGTASTDGMTYGQFTTAVSGTVTKIPKFTGVNSFGNSLMTDNGANVNFNGYLNVSSTATYVGMIGFNRDVSTGTILNSSYGAYQFNNHIGTLKLEVYNSSGTAIKTHTFNNDGTITFNGQLVMSGSKISNIGNAINTQDAVALGQLPLWVTALGGTDAKNDAGEWTVSGFYNTATPTNFYAGATSWQHLIEARHANAGNNYAMQISGSFFDNKFYGRKTQGSPTTAWVEFITTDNFNTLGDARFLAIGGTAANSGFLNGQNGFYYRNASNINAGTLGDSYLSINIPKLNIDNVFTQKMGIGGAVNSSFTLTVTGSQLVSSNLTVNSVLTANTATVNNAPTVTSGTQFWNVGTGGALEKRDISTLPFEPLGGIAKYSAQTIAAFTSDIGGGVLKHITTLDCENFYMKTFRVNLANVSALGGRITLTNARAGGKYTINYYNGGGSGISLFYEQAKKQDGSTDFGTFMISGMATHVFSYDQAGGTGFIQAF